MRRNEFFAGPKQIQMPQSSTLATQDVPSLPSGVVLWVGAVPSLKRSPTGQPWLGDQGIQIPQWNSPQLKEEPQ